MDYQHFNAIFRAAEAMQTLLLQQEREIALLTNGAANQAKTIRTLNERNSQLEAEVTLEKYNVEFLKQQARKTRLKTREYRKQRNTVRDELKATQAEIAELREIIEQHERTIETKRIDNRQLDAMVTNRNLEIASLKGAIDRIQAGKPLDIQYVTDRQPFKVERFVTMPKLSPFLDPSEAVKPLDTVRYFQRDVVRVTQTAAEIHIPPEARRDVRIHAELAQQVARSMVPKIEQAFLNALRGEETEMPDLRRLQYEERMRQQRQTYGTNWTDF